MKRQIAEFRTAVERMQAAKDTLIKKMTEQIDFPFDIEPEPYGQWTLIDINSGEGMPLDEVLALLGRNETEILTLNEFKKLC
jgi:hypothetical protein